MAKYQITVSRVLRQRLTVEVEADSPGAACDEAQFLARQADRGAVGGLTWEPDAGWRASSMHYIVCTKEDGLVFTRTEEHPPAGKR